MWKPQQQKTAAAVSTDANAAGSVDMLQSQMIAALAVPVHPVLEIPHGAEKPDAPGP